jgi:AsmA protein
MLPVPSATGLLRFSLAIAAVLAAGIAALIVASRLIPPDRVRQAVVSEIRAATGLEPAIRGDVTVSLFPTAMVSFSDVTLGDERAAPALAADRLTVRLALLPLLIGRIEPADLALTRPHVTVAVEPDGRSNWSGLMATLARTLKPRSQQAEHVMSLSELRMIGGTITVTEAARGISEELSNVEVSFAWPSISRSFGATGRFTWRGEAFDASANAGDLLAALSGDRSGLKLRLAGAPFKLAFDGAMSQQPSFKMEGTLAIDGKSLRQALRWTNRDPLPGSAMGPFALKAHTTFTGGTAMLSGVNMELDGNTAEGVMAIATEPRVTLKGTLAADTLDLSPYVATFEVLRSNDRDWSRGPIAVDNLSNFDLDLRLSAARVSVATAQLGRTGVAINLRDGRLTLAIGEAQAYGGVLKGVFTLARTEPGADVRTQLQFTDVELEPCLGELFGIRKLEGKGNLSLSVEATGDSVLALTRTLSGTADLTARQGAVAGFNVEQLLKRLEQRPLSIGSDFRRGRTPFDKMNATARITQGMANIEEMGIEGGAVRLALGGSASIPSRDLDLRGTATLISTAAGAPPVFELPFVVQGSWDDPIMLPDAQSLISRSNAAAPLLDAVRDRKTRDAVRSVIDRLNRSDAEAAPVRP